MQHPEFFDVIVIGGGHAGTEAAAAAARMGAQTLLLTHTVDTLGQMSCNPAIGGIGKGHLVREIDALGGLMAEAADEAGIQFRLLNRRKGPAVRATRAQADRALYRNAVRRRLENQPGLQIFQQAVTDLVVQGGCVGGVVTQGGITFRAKAVVLTTGTFLGGRIHIGLENHQGGRAGDPPANALAQRLRELDLPVGRLKTGTPPRIDGRSLDFSCFEAQPGDVPRPVFSFLGSEADHPRQVPCWITWTNAHTHELIRSGLDRSPMYAGVIEGVGPRYCPSVEDKVVRFAERDSHQVFIEPEGLNTHEIYPNGISTSLPFDIQYAMVRSIAGMERAHITRPGYAIEYDYFDPRHLQYSLECRALSRLFLAGQINGTTGYEEAAAQGLLAGLNAVRTVRNEAPWWPRRDQAYLGVLIDDLISRGTSEPYRMFTSRAEHRLLLREDNADLRLTAIGRDLGLVDDRRWSAFAHKRDIIEQERSRLKTHLVLPRDVPEGWVGGVLNREYRAEELLRRPQLSYAALMQLNRLGPGLVDAPQAIEQIEIQVRYQGYIERQQQEVDRQLGQDDVALPEGLDYAEVHGLSSEVREILQRRCPATLGQARRLPGVTPAAISLLVIHLRREKQARRSA